MTFSFDAVEVMMVDQDVTAKDAYTLEDEMRDIEFDAAERERDKYGIFTIEEKISILDACLPELLFLNKKQVLRILNKIEMHRSGWMDLVDTEGLTNKQKEKFFDILRNRERRFKEHIATGESMISFLDIDKYILEKSCANLATELAWIDYCNMRKMEEVEDNLDLGDMV